MDWQTFASDLVDKLVGVGGQLSIADNQAGAEEQEEGAESSHTLQKFVNQLTNSYWGPDNYSGLFTCNFETLETKICQVCTVDNLKFYV